MTTPPSPEDPTRLMTDAFYNDIVDGKLAAQAQPKIKVRKKLEPEEGSQLSLLFHQLPALEAAKKQAEEDLATHKRKIQQEVARGITDPNDMPDVFQIPADPHGGYPGYTLAARDGAWRLDSEAMKSEDPGTWQKWAKQGRPYWELSRVRTNRVKR